MKKLLDGLNKVMKYFSENGTEIYINYKLGKQANGGCLNE